MRWHIILQDGVEYVQRHPWQSLVAWAGLRYSRGRWLRPLRLCFGSLSLNLEDAKRTAKLWRWPSAWTPRGFQDFSKGGWNGTIFLLLSFLTLRRAAGCARRQRQNGIWRNEVASIWKEKFKDPSLGLSFPGELIRGLAGESLDLVLGQDSN